MPSLRQAARLLSATLAFGLGLGLPSAGLLLCPAGLHAQETDPITLAISESALTRDYTGQPAVLDPATDLLISPGSAADYTFKITYAGKTAAQRNAGSYAVKVVATTKTLPARTATATGTLVIQKVPLLVYANDQVRLFGSSNPSLTLSYDGFVNGETSTVLARRPAATTTAKTSSPAGEYDITVAGGSAKNYTFFGYNTGRLTVIPAFPGTYESFLYAPGDPFRPIGKLIVTLPSRGTSFTARLDLASEGAALAFSGKLAPELSITGASGDVSKKTAARDTYRIAFTISGEGLSPAIFLRDNGSSEEYEPFALGAATLLSSPGSEQPSPAGAYTFALLNPVSDAEDPFILSPGGLGFATATIDTKGVLKLSGKFSDGTTLTASAQADSARRYRLFLRPYGSRKNSYAAAELVLEPHPDSDRLDRYYVPRSPSELRYFYWIKAAGTKDSLFREGFGPMSAIMVLDPWLPPAKAKAATSTSEPIPAITLAQRLGLTANPEIPGFATIAYGFEYLGDSSVELPVLLECFGNKASPVLEAPPANPRAWKITSLNTKTGRFSGSFKLTDTDFDTDFDTEKVYTRNVTFQGILRQPPIGDTTLGAGYFFLKALPTAFDLKTRSVDIRFEKE